MTITEHLSKLCTLLRCQKGTFVRYITLNLIELSNLKKNLVFLCLIFCHSALIESSSLNNKTYLKHVESPRAYHCAPGIVYGIYGSLINSPSQSDLCSFESGHCSNHKQYIYSMFCKYSCYLFSKLKIVPNLLTTT